MASDLEEPDIKIEQEQEQEPEPVTGIDKTSSFCK